MSSIALIDFGMILKLHNFMKSYIIKEQFAENDSINSKGIPINILEIQFENNQSKFLYLTRFIKKV